MEANWQGGVGEAPAASVPTSGSWREAHRIVGIYEEEVTKEISGRPITRRGSDKNPVVLVERKDGARALKLASELESI